MANEISEYLGDIDDEFAGVDLGDKRRDARLRRIATRIAASPAQSFPKLVGSVAEREALYRLLSNDAVEWRAIIEPHFAATVARSTNQGRTRVVHDTTDFVFSGDRDGMGTVLQRTRGFFGHFALAISAGEERIPLGVVGLTPYVRQTGAATQPLNERKRFVRKTPRREKESSRWETLAIEVNHRFATDDVIHVMDQEADDFVLFAALQQAGLRFVIRGTGARLLERGGDNVQSVLDAQPVEMFRTVPLSARPKDRAAKNRKAHPPRQERMAQLQVRWAPLDVAKPQHAQTDTTSVALWVVQVFEPAPPPGEAPIEWTLFTSERVDDLISATAVVDHYRARWRIEEYFRALKQGCAVQTRQIESYDAMLRALALFIPIAWRLLLLRSLGQDVTPLPAEAVFDEDEMAAIAVLIDHKCLRKLPDAPTLRDVMLAIAAIGGHIRQNGEPGWIVLGRGFEDVLKAAIVWRAARAKM